MTCLNKIKNYTLDKSIEIPLSWRLFVRTDIIWETFNMCLKYVFFRLFFFLMSNGSFIKKK